MMERFLATVVFCEAPFEGTFAPSLPTAGAASGASPAAAESSSVMAATEGAVAQCFSSSHHPHSQQKKAGRTVDGLAIFETVALQ
ncbi:hypothetical protein ACP4OV_017278 [Aristida adscensionis]